jgi:hypothetical protein
MEYLGHYNTEGTYEGFYVEEIHGKNIPTPVVVLTEEEWQEALTGDYKVVEGVHTHSPVVIKINKVEDLPVIKLMRNNLLQSSDWTQLPDVPLTEEKKQEWREYRQELRKMGRIETIQDEFPIKPSK